MGESSVEWREPVKDKNGTTSPLCLYLKQHFKITKLIIEAGHKLKLPAVACASACVLYHRFFKQYQQGDYDPMLLGTTALYLASKTEEAPCKLRDVINVSYRTLHRDRAPLEVGSLYWELRDSVVNCELMMLRTLQFQVAFNNPHKYLLHYLKSLEDWADSKGARFSWWKALCPEVTEEEIKKIIQDMMEFYSFENKVIE